MISRFRTQKTAALLAYLALHPRPHAREVLIELLWPDSDFDAARTNLRVALNSLRRQLEPPGIPAGLVLQADRTSAGLNPAVVTTDVAEFASALRAAESADGGGERVQALAAAVEIYAGPLLPACYEDWVPAEQERLAHLYLEALSRLSRELQQRGEPERALDYSLRMAAADSLCEEAHRQVMHLYVVTGRPTRALRQYRELERILAEELQRTPSPAARRLRDQARSAVDSGQQSAVSSQEGGGERGSGTAEDSHGEQAPPRIGGPGGPSADLHPSSFCLLPLGSLPVTLTRFFGRESEIQRLVDLLSPLSSPLSARLLTLTGPGGSGKTRLAIEAARQLKEPYGGAVWFVPLAGLSEPGLIAGALRDALRLPRLPEIDPLEQAARELSRRPSLLVLDNFEHLVEKGAPVVSALLGQVETLVCLVTSREVLGIAGEQEFPLLPLPVPVDGEWLMVDGGDGRPSAINHQLSTLASCPSVQLFANRSQAARPDFQITPNNAEAAARLCHRLDGIPLAIELAAARAQILTPAQMLAELEHRFEFLVTRRRDAEERNRSLRAALDWSYRLLPAELQTFFRRLSVFRGGWNLEAAEAVWKAEGGRMKDEGGERSAVGRQQSAGGTETPFPNAERRTPTFILHPSSFIL